MFSLKEKFGFIMIGMVASLIFGSCSPSLEPGKVEVTKEVVVTEIVEVTRIVEIEKVITATPRPTPKPSPTQVKTMEDIQTDIGDALISDLEGFDDVERVNLVRFSEGVIEIEVQTKWASRDSQPEVSWKIITALASAFASMSPEQRMNLTGSENLTISLTTYSTDGDYRYKSDTDFDTMVKLENRSLSYSEWVQAANAGFR